MLRLSSTPRDRRAKDGEVGMSLGSAGAVVAVGRVVVGRVAWPQSLAAFGGAVGNVVCQWPTNRHHVAAGRGGERRLPGLLLLSRHSRTQCQNRGRTIVRVAARRVAAAGTTVAGHRRFADEALRPEGRRRGRASQSDSGSGRSTVSLRSCVGDDLAGAATSAMGTAGVAALGDALCAAANDRQDSQAASLAAIRDEAATSRAIGRVDHAYRENSREIRVDRRRRPIC